MPWDDDLLPEQKTAACHLGSHARLLAGPGTGKTLTLTRRICYLIEDRDVDPQDILSITFTRAASHELRERVKSIVGEENSPRILTLHSFALRQLLKNATKLTSLPQPFRIADDWEERNIILENLKELLGLPTIKETRGLLDDLSADWQSLTVEEDEWERRFPNPRFLGAWQQHRTVFGYVLRSELVYQLKRALEQIDDFEIEGEPSYLLVDEYQDLNRCDLSVVKTIGELGAEVYAAGDDDQSIYGFRKAHPEGIRRFIKDYENAEELELSLCKRCDKDILDLGLFVAEQDVERIGKPLVTEEGRDKGHIAILHFQDQDRESAGIARICKHLIENHGISPGKILILLRGDRKGIFSSVLKDGLERAGVPVSIETGETDPLNEDAGRQVLSLLRLVENIEDHLAWYTLLKLGENNIGQVCLKAIYEFAISEGVKISEALSKIEADTSLIRAPHGGRIASEVAAIRDKVAKVKADNELVEGQEEECLLGLVKSIIDDVASDNGQKTTILHQFERTFEIVSPANTSDLLRGIEVSREDVGQELEPDKVNILTMHKAKGLTAEAVIIAAAEKEYIPGRASGEEIGDERRLLYVSLTRAKRFLFITYCQKRFRRQRHSGSEPRTQRRHLTTFLEGAPIAPQSGASYLAELAD